MKQFSKFFTVSTYSIFSFASLSFAVLNAFGEDIPPAQLVPNRKPAVLPRVFIEAEQDAVSEASAADAVDFYYYDYNDQKPQGEQSPPLRLSQF